MVWTVDGGPGGPMTAPMNKLTRSPSCRIGDLIRSMIDASREEPARMMNFLIADDLLAECNGFDAPLVVYLCHHHQGLDAPFITSGIREKAGPDAKYISRQAAIDDP